MVINYINYFILVTNCELAKNSELKYKSHSKENCVLNEGIECLVAGFDF